MKRRIALVGDGLWSPAWWRVDPSVSDEGRYEIVECGSTGDLTKLLGGPVE